MCRIFQQCRAPEKPVAICHSLPFSPDEPKFFGSPRALPSRKTIRYSLLAIRRHFRLGKSLALPNFFAYWSITFNILWQGNNRIKKVTQNCNTTAGKFMDGEKGSLAKRTIDAKKCAKMSCGKSASKGARQGRDVQC